MGKRRADEESLLTADNKLVRKRNRSALSCTECKRRKIKCDRKLPCLSCCQRGDEKSCKWETTAAVVPAPQPFASVAEHERLKRRVRLLEEFIISQGAPPELEKRIEQFRGTSVARAESGSDEGDARSHSDDASGDANGDAYCGDQRCVDSDTEDAAIVLEGLALGRKAGQVQFYQPYSARTDDVSGAGVEFTAQPDLSLQNSREEPGEASLGQKHSGYGPAPPQGIQVAHEPSPTRSFPYITQTDPIPSYRAAFHEHILKALPPFDATTDWLVAHYIRRVDWGSHVLHRQTFLAEYHAAAELVKAGREKELDVLWVGLLYIVLCNSLVAIEHPIDQEFEGDTTGGGSPKTRVTITSDTLDHLPQTYFDRAQLCLECSQWTTRPRIRALQLVVLFTPYLGFLGSHGAVDFLYTHLAAAMRLALQMQLHRLGDDVHTMPVADPALPDTPSTLRRETAIRVFYSIVDLESHYFRTGTTFEGPPITTAFPGNFRDADLAAAAVAGVPATPRPDVELTESSVLIVKCRLARSHKFHHPDIKHDGSWKVPHRDYNAFLKIDSDYRKVPQELLEHPFGQTGSDEPVGWNFPEFSLSAPSASSQGSSSSESVKQSATGGVPFCWMQNLLPQVIHSRLIRLHRPFMSRAYRNPRYAPSRDAALESARLCLRSTVSLTTAPLTKAPARIGVMQSALIVIFLHAWTDLRPETRNSSDFRLVREVVPFLARCTQLRSAHARQIGRRALRVALALFDAFEARYAAAERRVRNGGPWLSEGDESYGAFLRRIGGGVFSGGGENACAGRDKMNGGLGGSSAASVCDPTTGPSHMGAASSTASSHPSPTCRTLGSSISSPDTNMTLMTPASTSSVEPTPLVHPIPSTAQMLDLDTPLLSEAFLGLIIDYRSILVDAPRLSEMERLHLALDQCRVFVSDPSDQAHAERPPPPDTASSLNSGDPRVGLDGSLRHDVTSKTTRDISSLVPGSPKTQTAADSTQETRDTASLDLLENDNLFQSFDFDSMNIKHLFSDFTTESELAGEWNSWASFDLFQNPQDGAGESR